MESTEQFLQGKIDECIKAMGRYMDSDNYVDRVNYDNTAKEMDHYTNALASVRTINSLKVA